jgi:putative inorganic carbon (HCO3(-)) transporter
LNNIGLKSIIVFPRHVAIFLDHWHWVLLAITAPLLLFPSPDRSQVLFIVPGLWILAWLAGHNPLQRTPINASLLLMFCMVLVSLWATFDLTLSLPKISGMVLGIGVFFAVSRESKRLSGLILSLLVFLGMGLGIAIVGVFGTSLFTSKITLFDPLIARLPRFVLGLQGAESGFHPNEVAGALIWVLPVMMVLSVALFFFLRTPKNEKSRDQESEKQMKMSGWKLVGGIILCLATTFITLAVFLLTQSRGGYIALAVTMTLLILIAIPRRWRWYLMIALVVLAIVLGVLVASRWETVQTWITDNNLEMNPALSLGTFQSRLNIWSRAIYGIQDFPFTGMGMNTFRKVMPELYPRFSNAPESDIGHAHNEFLQAALDLGIPGLIAFLGLYIGSFWMLVDVWKSTHQTFQKSRQWLVFCRTLALGLGGGLLAHLLYGLTDVVALGAKPGVLFWILLGLIAGLHQQTRDRVAEEESLGLEPIVENGSVND